MEGTVGPSNLNPSDVMLLDLCACHGLFKYKGVYMCTLHLDTLGHSSMIDFVVMICFVAACIGHLDEEWDELSIDHHLMVN